MPTILLSAGDVSGERHAADLVRVLRERMPDAKFVGMGGSAMARAGVKLHVDQRELAIGGVFEVFSSMPRLVSAWQKMKRCLAQTSPDLVILVDSGGFNLPFAKKVRASSNAMILYYVAPQIWAWRPRRFSRLIERTDRIAVILPFEKEYYAERGVHVDFVGHPAVDAMAEYSIEGSRLARTRARAALAVDDDYALLGIFPGSRRNELAQHLPLQLDAFLDLRAGDPKLAGLKAIVGLAPSLDVDEARRLAASALAKAPDAIRFVSMAEGEQLGDACDVALAKPGTITVELMLRRKPMVVVGRVNPATAIIARRSLRIKWLSMPNLIAKAPIVPEFIQEAATRDRIAAALAPLFSGAPRERQIEDLDRASRLLGEPGAAARLAGMVEEMLESAST